jgi:hypothetical protein
MIASLIGSSMATALRVLIFLAVGGLVVLILLCGSRLESGAMGKPPIAWPFLMLSQAAMAVVFMKRST